MVERNYCVYMHVFNNGNKYIGITNNPEERFEIGFNFDSNSDWGKYNDYVLNTFNKHGLKETVFLHDDIKEETAKILEIIQIDLHNSLNSYYGGLNSNGLNMKKGGDLGIKMKGELNPNTIFTYDKVRDIELFIENNPNKSLLDISVDFKVSHGSILKINDGLHWGSSNSVKYPIKNINSTLNSEEIINIENDIKYTNMSYKKIAEKYNRCHETIIDINRGFLPNSNCDKSKYPIRNIIKRINQGKMEDILFIFFLDIYNNVKIGELFNYNMSNFCHVLSGKIFKNINLDDIQNKVVIFVEKTTCGISYGY